MRDLWRVVWRDESWWGVRESECGGGVGRFWGSSKWDFLRENKQG